MRMLITFETKVWENDWESLIKTPRLEKMIKLCHSNFSTKVLYINNVSDRGAVEAKAEDLILNKIIDKYVYVDAFADLALNHFNLSREKLGRGYYYSIAELVSIYLAKTEYLLHFSGDTIAADDVPPVWLEAGIKSLKDNRDVKVFNLTWNNSYDMAKRESQFENEDCYFGFGFSDQMYLVRSAEFKERIYEYYDEASKRYPAYGGDLFEKRVDSWMRQKKYLRATYKHGSYIHENFPKKEQKSSARI